MSQHNSEPLTTSEMLYQELKQDIIQGVYPSGEKIKLESIKARYNVSYSPLREALSRLAENQLLISSGQRGFRVPAMTQAELDDITETRVRLECMALEMAIEKGDMEWESHIVAAYHLLSQQEKKVYEASVASQEDIEQLDKVHEAFHQALLSGAQSEWMLFFVKSLNAQFDRYRRNNETFNYSQQTSVAYHRKLKDLALERNTAEAVKALEAHIRYSAKAIRCRDEDA